MTTPNTSQSDVLLPSMPSIEPEDATGLQDEQRIYYASQWRLIWWRFRRHKLAVISLVLLVLLYLSALFADFLSPYADTTRISGFQQAPPSVVHIYKEGEGFQWPFVYTLERTVNPETFRREFTEITNIKYPIRLLVRGESYKLLGIFPTDIHLFGVDEPANIRLFGSDDLGRDVFSRVLYGARVSLSIGLVGVFLSFLLGCILGGISGYFGGVVDSIVQRMIDFLNSIPTLPLWMVIAAAVPVDWPVTQTYFAITIILSVVGWTSLARVVRGKLITLREEEYTLAARAAGASTSRIIFRHLMPGFTSHLIVAITLSVPGMILAETALSFIGLGMQPPAVSWGTLLQNAQDITAIALRPWQLIPALFVIMTVFLFNFIGDGLRDAADPYAT